MLYAAQLPDYSGAELAQLPILRADADPIVACPAGSRFEELMHREGIPTTALPFRALRHSGGRAETLRSVARGLAVVRDLRRILRAHRERRIVYAFQIRPGLTATLAAVGLGRRVVWNVTDALPPGPLGAAIRAVAMAGRARLIVHSQVMARNFLGGRRWPARRASVISPGVDLARHDARASHPGRPRAVLVGHISPTKRTDLAVEIAGLVAREREDFELEILGRAQFRDEDRAFEAELHRRVASDPALARAVRFAGYTDDVPARLAAAGLLLHCRPDEPFGMAVTEAMATGLPVVAPAAAGPAEILEDGVTGLLYPPGDAQAAATAVLRLLDDPDLAAAMGRAGRRVVEERYSMAAQVTAVDGLLADLAGDT